MARLPIPGADTDSWAPILNEYLQVGHTASGGHIGVLALPLGAHLTFSPDGTFDIGAVGASRPGNVYLSSLLSVGGTANVGSDLNVGGAADITGQLYARNGLTSFGTIGFQTDNANDFGATASSRPRTIYVGTSLVVPLIGTATGVALVLAPANHIVEQRNGANNQVLYVYGTYTNSTNYERLLIGYSGGGFRIDAQRNGSGVTRQLDIAAGTSLILTAGAGNNLDLNVTGGGGWSVSSTGMFRPQVTNTQDLGLTSARIRNLFLGSFIEQTQIATPAAPASGAMRLYPKADGHIYSLNSAGVETDLSSATGTSAAARAETGGLFAGALPVLATFHREGDVRAPLLTTLARAGSLSLPSSVAALPEATSAMVTAAQAAITAAPAGSTIDLTTVAGAGPGIYRTAFTGPSAANVTISGNGQISVRGSNDWSTGGTPGNTWSASGSNYRSSLTFTEQSAETGLNSTVPVLGGGTYLFDATHREMVFLNGVPQRRVSSGSTLAAGQWKAGADNGTDNRVTLFANPGSAKVEVTIRASWATNNASGTTWDGIDFRHAPSANNQYPPLTAGNGTTDYPTTWRNCMIGHTHGCALAPGGVAGVVIEDCVFHDIGSAAVQTGTGVTGIVLARNVVFNCAGALRHSADVLDWAGYDYTWGSGGFKVVGSDSIIMDRNILWNIGFAPLWTDISAPASRWGSFTNNVVFDCRGYGIHVEISAYQYVAGNVVFWSANSGWTGTDHLGIYTSSSRYVEIGPRPGDKPNIVMRMPMGIKVGGYTRGDQPAGGFVGNTIHDNIVICRNTAGAFGGPGIFWGWQDGASGANISNASNRGWSNSYGRPATETGNVMVWSDDYLWFSDLQGQPGQDGSGYYISMATVAASRWEVATPPDGGTTATRYMSESERVGHLGRWGLPLT